MRILLAHNFYQQPGGEDVVFRSETDLLAQHGHEVFQFTASNDSIHGRPTLRQALETVWSARSHARLLQTLASVRPDVVHFHNTFPIISPSAYHACRTAGVPVVQSLHNFRLRCANALYYRDGRVCEDCLSTALPWPAIKHACYRGSRPATAAVAMMNVSHRVLGTWASAVDVYIALSRFARDLHIRAGLPAHKVVVKPNFVAPDPGPGCARERRDFAVYVGRLSPEKGVRTLVESWRQRPGIALKIIGDGPLRAEMESTVESAGLSPTVHILGALPREQVYALLRSARFAIVPSECYENFPVAIAEAFACATPVLASALGTLPELVDDGRTGWLFPPADSAALACQVAWAVSHPAEVSTAGLEARAAYEAAYTADRNYGLLMDIYTGAIAAHQRPSRTSNR